MLSWMTNGSQRPNLQAALWFEDELSMQRSTNTAIKSKLQAPDQAPSTSYYKNTRFSIVLPKIRKALETAATNSNGSFPIIDSPRESSEFEACDLDSQCSNPSMAYSSATGISYDMSLIGESECDDIDDADSIPTNCDTLLISPAQSDTNNSFFGTGLRETYRPQSAPSGDDVWLLSNTVPDENVGVDSVTSPDKSDIKSPTGSILSKVPVLILSRTISKWELDDDEQEETIDFRNNNSFRLDSPPSVRNYRYQECDENNQDGKIMHRVTNGRRRAQIIGKSFKDLWSNMEYRRKSKVVSRQCLGSKQHSSNSKNKNKKRQKKRKKIPLAKITAENRKRQTDPLKELSLIHEQMAQSDHPMPPRASAKSSEARRTSGERFLQLDKDSFVSTEAEKDGIIQSSSMPNFATDQPIAVDEVKANDPINYVLSTGAHGIPTENEDFDDAEVVAATAKQRVFNFKVSSPRRDTAHIIWADESSDQTEVKEPRVLYTSEGEVAAIIHPRPSSPQVSSLIARTSPGNGIDHVFHSELSTLYEESSSLESASFGTFARSRSASLGEENWCGKVLSSSESGNSRVSKSEIAPSACGGDKIGLKSQLDQILSVSRLSEKNVAKHGERASPRGGTVDTDTVAVSTTTSATTLTTSVGSLNSRKNQIDDDEVKARWEFSLGLMRNAEHGWRHGGMTLMNSEELADDYAIEI